jgi:Ni/Fe-hydrogenase subunit HybB-like protein
MIPRPPINKTEDTLYTYTKNIKTKEQTVQTLALPTLPFDQFLSYTPSWQEVGTFVMVVAYAVLVYSFSFRYFNVFPEERELRIAPPPPPQEKEEELVLTGSY